MANIAAHVKKIKIQDPADSAGGFSDASATSGALSHGGDIIDDTEMATNAGFRTRLYGLRDHSITLSGIYDPTNTAVADMRAAWLGKTNVDAQYLPDGSTPNGFEASYVVESFNISGDISGAETFDITLQGDGALAAAS